MKQELGRHGAPSVRTAFTRRRLLDGAGRIGGVVALGAFLAPFAVRRAEARFLANPDPSAVAETSAGRIRGGIADGIHIFRGVPYGAPTGGEGRFMPPAPPAPWDGVADMMDYGPSCPQEPYDLVRPAAISWFTPFWPQTQSEDCLRLNVWTPGVNDGGKRPVLVWLHGGGFSQGSGSSSSYEGTNMAKRGDVVVVTVNHRLNVFGYLDLSELAGADFAHSGNAGMLDIVLALEWVRDNIAGFGGDPGNVMIFGESGGGAKVSTLLAMPAARGLFHRAAIQSGPGLRAMMREDAAKLASYLVEELDLVPADIDGLRAVPADRLVAAQAAATARAQHERGGAGGPGGFRPVLGADLPEHPFDPVASPLSAGVPILIGTNRHEVTLFSTGDPALFALDDAALAARFRPILKDRAGEAIATYRAAYPEATPSDLYFVLMSDRFMRLNSIRLAERKEALGRAPVFMYRFDWQAPAWEGRLRAAHAFEIPFVFDNAQLNSDITGGTPDAAALAARMCEAWTAFARNGDPNHSGLPAWPAYESGRRATMLFNDACGVADDPGSAERRMWARFEAEARG